MANDNNYEVVEESQISDDAPPVAKEHEEKPLHELLSHSIVDIYVSDSTYPLHEKLLCHHSPVLRSHFYRKGSKAESYGLADESPAVFSVLVGWLYSRTLSYPVDESGVGPLLELYLLSERLQMAALSADVVDTVRMFYHSTSAYPSLRRVQYVYENTGPDNPMRDMMVGSVARYLTLGEQIPKHWDGALRRNGQLAVDIIRAIQEWHLESRSVPDVRDKEVGRMGLSGAATGNGSEAGDGGSYGGSTNGSG